MHKDLSKVAPQIISIRSDLDIIAARMAARDASRKIGFSNIDQARIATATSELTRNILAYAQDGTVTISEVQSSNRRGIEIIFEDNGPGIENLNGFMHHDTSPTQVNGFGLAGSRRLMDHLEINTTTGVGTRIICHKWVRS